MKNTILSLILAVSLPAWAGNACDSDETLYRYLGLYQCQLGSAPQYCVPTASLLEGAAGLGVGAATYKLSGKLADQLAKPIADKMAARAKANEAEIARETMAYSRAYWGEATQGIRSMARKMAKGQVVPEFESLRNKYCSDIWGVGMFPSESPTVQTSRMLRELNDHATGKAKLSEARIHEITGRIGEILDTQIEEYEAKNKGSYADRENTAAEKSRSRWQKGASRGIRAGAGVLGGVLAIAGPDLAKQAFDAKRFNQCYRGLSSEKDLPLMREFVEARGSALNVIPGNKNCELVVQPQAVMKLLAQYPEQRTQFFEECPSCCKVLQASIQQMQKKLIDEMPKIDEQTVKCDGNSFPLSIHGRNYDFKIRNSGDGYVVTGKTLPGDITVSDSLNNRLNEYSVKVINGQFQYLHLSNPVTAPYNLSAKLPQSQIDFVLGMASGEQGVATSIKDLNDPQKVTASVGEQLAALNASFTTIQSVCEASAGAGPTPASRSGASH